MRFAKRLISVANATRICLNNDIIDTIALVCSPVFEGDKEQDAKLKRIKKRRINPHEESPVML